MTDPSPSMPPESGPSPAEHAAEATPGARSITPGAAPAGAPAQGSVPGGPTILYRTDGWMVLNKPQGWHVMAKQDGNIRSVEAWLKANEPQAAALPECGLVHRLDVGTTGCLLVALDAAQRKRLRQLFSAGASPPAGAPEEPQGPGVRKIYLAIARRGLPSPGRFVMYFTGRHKSSAKVSARLRGEPRERGECSWQVLGPSRYLGHDIVQVELHGPGRRHQIRAGLAYGGHPLLGDATYGGAPGTPCPALHAYRLVLNGVEVECPPDERFTRPSTQP